MLPLQNKPLLPHIDARAWKQVEILASKSAIFKIQWPNRLIAVLFWIGITLFGILYPFTIGLAIFSIGFFNYVLLLSFRLSNNFTRKSSATENTLLQEPVIWPSFSVIVPLKEEDDVIHATLQAIHALVYPNHLKQVIIVVEDTDLMTQKSLRNAVLPANFQVLYIPTAPPFTKARALLHALKQATGTYITVYDAESRPEPYQLKKAALALLDSATETCFQAKIKISNQTQNWITRNFAGEYYEWYERHLSELSARGLPFGLGGNSFFISKDALERAGAWDPFNVTEDADLSVRLAENGVQLRILDSITTESCPETPKNWINQRTRWNKGLFITQLVHLKRTLRNPHFKGESWLSFWLPMISAALVPFFNFYIPFYMTWGHLSYPILLVLSTTLWVLFFFNLLCSLLINVLTYQRLGMGSYGLWVLTDWFGYLFLQIMAGFKAYAEYFISPMYWHKTEHIEQHTPETKPNSIEPQFSFT